MARVGLLEDNTVIARLSATMLHYVGHQVIIYERPQDCLNALSLTGAHNILTPARAPETKIALPVELLILDLHLPDIDGLHILELIQAHQHTRSLPLIFCTAATDREIAYALQLAPQAQLVEKPFKMQTLVSAVSNVLQEL
ncbi:MAG TPA: response regulator [Ktedonobacteraceae bacterium]|nr:response regulator [Ktedonobacteraceae bacterium]